MAHNNSPHGKTARRQRLLVVAGAAILALSLGYGVVEAWAHGNPPNQKKVVDPALQQAKASPTTTAASPSFVNWETPHVHPLDLTPDRSRILAVNTADNRLEVFAVGGPGLQHIASIPVGLDPVSVRARTNNEAWVVNHISDDVSVVDLGAMNVVRTFRTDDEPCDVVFAGTPQRAYISCSQANTILAVNPANVQAQIADVTTLPNPGGALADGNVTIRIRIQGEDPRGLAVSADGSQVYAAIFDSGNRTTILAGGALGAAVGAIPNVVDDPLGPYFDASQPPQIGVNPPNPPPNAGALFSPPLTNGLPTPPRVGLIVKKNDAGRWRDDNAHDWTNLVSGPNASHSGRPVGWDLVDHDVAIINTTTLSTTYANGLMNLCMALAVNPASGQVTVVGIESTNDIRFEPNLNGRFVRVNFARFNPSGPNVPGIKDLNSHLTYPPGPAFTPIPQDQRNLSIGDPRGITWNSAGTRGWVTGMGSNNVVAIDATGARTSPRPINVGEGPTGILIDEVANRLYVLNKLEATISTISTTSNLELLPRTPLFDPTPPAIKIGRKHLYDTHRNSGLGQASCASCHADSRMDHLGWDLGNPAGAVKDFDENCNGQPPLGSGCQDWHPMKGPMTTQTLQDIIGKEPHHWRGDRNGLEEFANAFRDLLGDDQPLADADMQEFEDFLATIHFPPNPNRNFDNNLPANLSLSGQFSDGRFATSGGLPFGAPMPPGNAQTGFLFYRYALLDGGNCATCHSVPTGAGPDVFSVGGQFQPVPPGPNGEHHLVCVSADGSTNRTIKIPHLRNQYEKTGFDFTQQLNTAGFGFLHDGSIDSITRFISLPAFNFQNDQQIADMVSLMLSFAGSDFPPPIPPPNPPEPPGVASQDAHAAVGWQTTLMDSGNPLPGQSNLIAQMIAQADAGKVGLVVKGKQNGLQRGYAYIAGTGQFQSDRAGEVISAPDLEASAAPGSELTYTVVPRGSETRIGIDRDEDGYFDRDEIEKCGDPANPLVIPVPIGDLNDDGAVTLDDVTAFVAALLDPAQDPIEAARADINCDGSPDGLDVPGFVKLLLP